MPYPTIREFESRDLDWAAELLAAAHVRRRRAAAGAWPLSARHTMAAPCRSLLETLLADSHTDGVVAEQDGGLLGYLFGERQSFAPDEFPAVYAEPNSVAMPLHGHALAEGADAYLVYGTLYAELARRWVEDGRVVHTLGVAAAESEDVGAWQALGFGRKSVCVTRSLADFPAADAAAEGAVDAPGRTPAVELCDLTDEPAMARFHRSLMRYQIGAPMFWPYTGEADGALGDVRRRLIADGRARCFAARVQGEPKGMMLFTAPVFLSPLETPEGMVYLWEAFLDPDARAGGIGRALLARALGELKRAGNHWCALHYVAGNLIGGRFWTEQGFRPLEYILKRHVDERLVPSASSLQ